MTDRVYLSEVSPPGDAITFSTAPPRHGRSHMALLCLCYNVAVYIVKTIGKDEAKIIWSYVYDRIDKVKDNPE